MITRIASTADVANPAGVGFLCEEQEAGRRQSDSQGGPVGADRRGRMAPGHDGGLTLAVAAKDYIWLYDFRHGIGDYAIAARDGVSVRQVREGLERAQALERNFSKENPIEDLKTGRLGAINFRLVPLFPIGPFIPQSACPHNKPVTPGSSFCCMVCHASGMDDHPGLRRDPLTDPSPEPKPAPAPDRVTSSKSGGSQETRKQRRRRQFVEAVAVA